MTKRLEDNYFEFHLFESPFESFRPESQRKSSFIDLLSAPQGIPEVPNIDKVPNSIEELHVPLPSIEYSPSKMPDLDSVLPTVTVLPKRPRRLKREPADYSSLATRSRPVGILSAAERMQKILRYLEKKKARKWSKRVSYDCRKRVADNRLRIKGRFVTKEQAIELLGIGHSLVQSFIAREREDSEF